MSFSVVITVLTPSATPIAAPADSGIASRYPGDKNIGSDPAVILADDFESYTALTQLSTKWTKVQHPDLMRLATESGNVFAGGKALEMTLPISAIELAASLSKTLSPARDTVYVRMYHKFDPNYDVTGSNHNGIKLDANAPGTPGTPSNGTWFTMVLQNNQEGRGEATPGYSHIYAYWPKQRSGYGDHWYPDGNIIPGGQGDWLLNPAQYPDFKVMPNFLPLRDRWYCVELMVHTNTIGKHDGEVAFWIDGKLAGRFPDLVLRTVDTAKMDEAWMGLGANHSEKVNKKWYDNVVIATQYIGPMASASPTPTPTVSPSPTQRLKNISTRGIVQTGNGVLIGGFILQGNTSKEILIRGLGPSLSAFGVVNVLSDPLIELHDSSGALIGSNHHWRTDFNHSAIPVELQPSNDSESALDRTLSPGSYTVIMKGARGQTGVGLFELYDLGGGGSVLENISTRGVVQTGDDVMIGGFTLAGDVGSKQRVIVRAIGPSLARFGVTNCLANPHLRVFDSNGALIAENDDWQESQGAEIVATGLAPVNARESAMILNLPPGNYTAIVFGIGGGTGNGLVEVYMLPGA